MASVLRSADLGFQDEYRSDGGGGYLLPGRQLFISVLPPEADPAAWALSHGYRASWETQGVTVFGSSDESHRIVYLYWHAGDVDSWVEWNSENQTVEDVRSAIDKIVSQQLRNPYPGESSDEEKYVGFYPQSHVEDGRTVMPLTFVDGSSAEVVAPPDLGIQEMSASIYTAGGLVGVDRTMNFRFGEPAGLVHEGPLETYEAYDGRAVEVWKGTPGDWECPNLVFRFEDWYVGVRTCQRELSTREKDQWARSLRGDVTEDGFLVLSADPPLVLQETGGHEGPELILGMDRANWIELEPGRCDPAQLPDEGDIRTMEDGTRVSFSRIGGADSKIEYNWYAEWCEDNLMRVQVTYAYKGFAESAAESFRLQDIVLAD